ncbi:hypothetical protein J4U01_gp053 [Mycobacterium phage Kumao]|uniref:Uncharacterized protein n=1 Tax=Mycobacterium phage Kumao TaxID=2041344 RepID=A0A2D1GPP1_9CAUD|nr:hypothetical protein J4U01_gp053 [Mycobacterium phage Kumao]ATN94016.1 hypothetical protein SEA_KUMAO_53 [Mycobacterium phage Kumao]
MTELDTVPYPPIILKVEQDLDHDGYQDENGTEHYDDRVVTPFGELENLEVEIQDDGQPFVKHAPRVCLVRRGFPDEWAPRARVGVTVRETPFGAKVMRLEAKNCIVSYHLHPNPLQWSDRNHDGLLERQQLATRTLISWKHEA